MVGALTEALKDKHASEEAARSLRCACLRRAGWSFDWCSVATSGGGERRLVDGTSGENALRAEAATLAEALRLAPARGRERTG